jgi:hypothetical protein
MADTDPLIIRIGRTLPPGPARRLRVVRNRYRTEVRPRASRAWAQLAQQMARMAPTRNVATTNYLGLADGHTLNVQAALPGFDGVAPSAAELVFSQEGVARHAPAAVRTDDGDWLVEAAVVLGNLPGRLALDGGVWQLGLAVTLQSGATRRLALRRVTVGPARTGSPTTATPPCPDTATMYRPTTSPFGTWQLTVRPGQPRAEVVRVRMDLDRTEVIGRFVGVADPAGAVAQLSRRGDRATRDAAVSFGAGLFRIVVPLAEMAPAPGTKDIWDLRVILPDGQRLRVGRFLHDLSNLKNVLRPIERRMLVPGGAAFRLNPYYTPAGSLALACISATPGVDS